MDTKKKRDPNYYYDKDGNKMYPVAGGYMRKPIGGSLTDMFNKFEAKEKATMDSLKSEEAKKLEKRMKLQRIASKKK